MRYPYAHLLDRLPDRERELRTAVVEEAYSWLEAKTPFREAGDTKGVGVDCTMLMTRVFVDTGVVPPFDERPYPPRWFLKKVHPELLEPVVLRYGKEIPVKTVLPGDLLMYKIGRHWAHVAVVVSSEHMIHAFWAIDKVSITEIRHSGFSSREHRAFTMREWGE